MTARLLACLLCWAGTARAAMPEPGSFMRDVEAARIDPASYDFAAAGFWTLDPAARVPWPWIAAIRPGEQTADFMGSCKPADQRRFAGLGWTLLASKSPDASTWQQGRGALIDRLEKLDASLEAAAAAVKTENFQPVVVELQRRFTRDQAVRLAMTDPQWLKDLPPVAAEHWGLEPMNPAPRLSAPDCPQPAK